MLLPDRRQEVRDRLEDGELVPAIARAMKTSRQTIMRAREDMG
ncbi:MAG: hypothetical protein OXC57_02490 [Rhodobacteraceae bacterium]|nr:hypothetical protein [Paracoccaceae bacterium]